MNVTLHADGVKRNGHLRHHVTSTQHAREIPREERLPPCRDGVKRGRCIHLHRLHVRNVHFPLLGFGVWGMSQGDREPRYTSFISLLPRGDFAPSARTRFQCEGANSHLPAGTKEILPGCTLLNSHNTGAHTARRGERGHLDLSADAWIALAHLKFSVTRSSRAVFDGGLTSARVSCRLCLSWLAWVSQVAHVQNSTASSLAFGCLVGGLCRGSRAPVPIFELAHVQN